MWREGIIVGGGWSFLWASALSFGAVKDLLKPADPFVDSVGPSEQAFAGFALFAATTYLSLIIMAIKSGGVASRVAFPLLVACFCSWILCLVPLASPSPSGILFLFFTAPAAIAATMATLRALEY